MLSLKTIADVKSVDFHLTTEEDREKIDLVLDFTMAEAIHTCPTWGVVRYILGKSMSGGGRSMPLEAGAACHDVFAAIRLLELRNQGLPDHFEFHGTRIYGQDRWEQIKVFLDSKEDKRTIELNFSLEALYSSGFYDDPKDKRRTLTNLEECCIYYFDRWPFGKWPIWVRDRDNPSAAVGIECPMDIVITYTMHDGCFGKVRYVGRMDGLQWHKNDSLYIHENKTASRLDESWLIGHTMSHQTTGYAVGAQLFTGEPCDDAMLHGLCIPLPRSYDFGGVVDEPLHKHPHQYKSWLNWVLEAAQYADYYRSPSNVLSLPQRTHSCNRYYSTCPMVPYCYAPEDERLTAIEEMSYQPWSPLAEEKFKVN